MSKEKTLRIAPDQLQRVINKRHETFSGKSDKDVIESLCVSKTLYYDFIGGKQGKGVGVTNFHHICRKLGFNTNEIHEIGIPDEPQAGLPSGTIPLDRFLTSSSSKGLPLATLAPQSSYQIEFVSYVADRTWKFVGRNYVFHEIERFFSRNKNGSFCSWSSAGHGKLLQS